ncbi:MAG: 50S ribosomal protein L18 [Endomicrobium sp.]|jgi:large subunit ribosomal protein L18|nr:50S ribosomal protein L18 [Endomicrobium sp.]MDR2399647.1 50S ribosomal protein L18 [Endomicrobium sp.]
MKCSNKRFDYRIKRVRSKIEGTQERPRLSIHRGHKHIYAQVIDDSNSSTIASASTLSPELKGKLKVTDTVAAAKAVGELIAKKASEKGVKKIVFDRRGYEFTGKVKAFADAARDGGLDF